MEYDDSFETDDGGAGEKEVADAALSPAAAPGQTAVLLNADEYGSDTFEQVSSDDEYADESFDPPPSPQHQPSARSSPGVVQSSAPMCTQTTTGQEADFPLETLRSETTPAIDDSPPQPGPTWRSIDVQSFVAAKLQKLSTDRRCDDGVPPSHYIRVPACVLHSLQRPAPHVADSSSPRRRRRSTTPAMTVPAGMVDRVRIQTLLSSMQHDASSSAPAHPDVETRSLFGFVARHHSRMHDQLWAMQIDALEARQRQSHDTLGWIADHMRRHREAHEPV